MFLSVALIVSAANPVYAGVVKRNVTASTNVQDTKGPVVNTDQGQESKNQETQATTDQSKQTDQSKDWLGPDGVAKTPPYSDTEVTVERDIGNPDVSHIFNLYQSKYRVGDIKYPEVNPATDRPLWDTQPFWREDGSFDLYGYLKQFIPIRDGMDMHIELRPHYKTSNEFTTMYGELFLYLSHKSGQDFEKIRAAGTMSQEWSVIKLSVRLLGSYEPSFADYYDITESISFDEDRSYIEGFGIEKHAVIGEKDLAKASKVRVTGTKDAYIYDLQVSQLEEIMREYIENPSEEDPST